VHVFQLCRIRGQPELRAADETRRSRSGGTRRAFRARCHEHVPTHGQADQVRALMPKSGCSGVSQAYVDGGIAMFVSVLSQLGVYGKSLIVTGERLSSSRAAAINSSNASADGILA
jgi:hypothetical protein